MVKNKQEKRKRRHPSFLALRRQKKKRQLANGSATEPPHKSDRATINKNSEITGNDDYKPVEIGDK